MTTASIDHVHASSDTETAGRQDLGAVLRQLVSVCAEDGGGVVAMFGMPGTGKSTLAHQFARNTSAANYFDGSTHPGGLLPALHGIAVIDEVWQFKNATDVIATHVTHNKGVVVALACVLSELEKLCGDHIKAAIEVSHWRSPGPTELTFQRDQIKKARNGRKIKFRGPMGEAWSGVGRTPRWLLALEMAGHSRDGFRIESPVDQKSRKD